MKWSIYSPTLAAILDKKDSSKFNHYSVPKNHHEDYGKFQKEERVITEIGTDWFENVELSGTPSTCKIETGAQANVIALSVVGKITGNPDFERSDTKLINN